MLQSFTFAFTKQGRLVTFFTLRMVLNSTSKRLRWIRIILGSWIRIRIRVKSWIRMHIKVKNQKIQWLKIEPWRTVNAHNGGLEGSKWSTRGPLDRWSQIPITLMMRRILIRNWIRITIESWIRIRVKVMRIRNPDSRSPTLHNICRVYQYFFSTRVLEVWNSYSKWDKELEERAHVQESLHCRTHRANMVVGAAI